MMVSPKKLCVCVADDMGRKWGKVQKKAKSLTGNLEFHYSAVIGSPRLLNYFVLRSWSYLHTLDIYNMFNENNTVGLKHIYIIFVYFTKNVTVKHLADGYSLSLNNVESVIAQHKFEQKVKRFHSSCSWSEKRKLCFCVNQFSITPLFFRYKQIHTHWIQTTQRENFNKYLVLLANKDMLLNS